jgi:1,4-dihydroxy-2-naphthoate polyprenyltransferase
MSGVVNDKLFAWIGLSRLPFLLVGVLPYVLGTVMAAKEPLPVRWGIFLLGLLGALLIMLSTYYGGEYWDYEGDALSSGNRFAGGTRVMLKGILSKTAPLTGSIVALILAAAVGLTLQFICHTGAWTLPLGIAGMIGGFFYSTRPVRWVATGTGELWIAFCYGWLPVAAGYYLQAGTFAPAILPVSLPIACSIFSVILLNEFSDYEADKTTGKKNLTVRLGKKTAAGLYVLIMFLSAVSVAFSLLYAPGAVLLFYLPVFLLSLMLAIFMVRGFWQDGAKLELMCGLNILVNIALTGVYLLAFYLYG